jgi:hypothetical protein
LPKVNINEFPLIAITELLDMESGDAVLVGDGSRTLEDILDRKYSDVQDTKAYRDWDGLDWKQQRPIYVEPGIYGRTLRNGHHRAAKGHAVGLLFMHYTGDFHVGWDQD